jgi:hypothetical protein
MLIWHDSLTHYYVLLVVVRSMISFPMLLLVTLLCALQLVRSKDCHKAQTGRVRQQSLYPLKNTPYLMDKHAWDFDPARPINGVYN